jgi:formate dehydrogenase maturation protein FdhE
MINASGISYLTCPFCNHHWAVHKKCDHCEWGKNHGRCDQGNSELARLKNSDKFTNRFYRRILKKIGA